MTDIEQALQYIDCSTLNYTEWIQVGMAIKEAGMGCEVWDAWSALDGGRYHPGDCDKHWSSFNGSAQPITQAYIFKLAKDNGWRKYDGNDETLEWDGVIEYDGDTQDAPKWNPAEDFRRYLQALFQPDEHISWVTEAKQDEDGKWKPAGKGCYWKTCAEVLKSLEKHEDISDTIGDYEHEAGAWIRFNPVNGEGVNNGNVTAYRFALVESDTMPLDAQYRMYRKLNLPIAAMVTSGGKSIHAIVHIDAANAAEYRDRVEMLYTILANKGMVVDTQNKNPSRLSRLPGCVRGNSKQTLVGTNFGCANWDAWLKYNESNTDDWPDIVPLSDALKDPPPLADVLIEGILRKGHKMLISGPSKAGKSFFLMELAVALANGQKWIGFQCHKSRVLYINFEIDSASCIHRFMDIRAALKERQHLDCSHNDDLMVWNLRGHAMPLNEMVPKITAKCKDFNLDVILVDPIYKVLMGDENNASDMGAFCNEFDKIANLLHCSVIYCHHHSKGAQGFKKAMDRASGSGVFARDPDAQLDMLEIEAPENCKDATTDTAWQIESSLREFPNIIPKRIWFRYPLHEKETEGELKSQPVKDGSKGGRPSKIDDDKIEMYFDQYAVNGFASTKDIANALEVHENSVRGYKSSKFEWVSRKGLRRVDG